MGGKKSIFIHALKIFLCSSLSLSPSPRRLSLLFLAHQGPIRVNRTLSHGEISQHFHKLVLFSQRPPISASFSYLVTCLLLYLTDPPMFSAVFQMFLTVYLSNNDQHFTEVPVTPDTLCRDVVELCKEPGETDCHLAEVWRGSGESPCHFAGGEKTCDLLQPQVVLLMQ